MDSVKMIQEEEKQLHLLEEEKQELLSKCKKLEAFQNLISEVMHRFFESNENIEDKNVLSSLCSHSYTAADKISAVQKLKKQMDVLYEELVKQILQLNQQLEKVDHGLEIQSKIAEDCKKHQNNFGQIPEYVGLKNEINREFEKRKIPAKAMFACEYVIGLKDEAWRDAIEAFLGPRRYTILVEPQYYDMADDILNQSQYRYAHLFNTKLLMKKKVKAEEDSVVDLLEIKNPVAKQYFSYQLGRMHAVELKEVRNYENAIESVDIKK